MPVARWTGFDADRAGSARVAVPRLPGRCGSLAFDRADRPAGIAVQTEIGADQQLRSTTHPLGVVAPAATEGAAFEKDRRPDPGAVMDGASLEVEDLAFELRSDL